MAKIVYGFSGEGSGHSSRAREVATHLLAAGHDVRLASYDRGLRNLADEFDVLEIEGLRIATTDNEVRHRQTVLENIRRLPEGGRRFVVLRDQLFREFQPDVVLCDFEPMTAYLANHYDLPLISIDNQHRMRYMDYQIPPGLENEARLTRNIIRAMVPRPAAALVTTFYFGHTKNDRTFLFPPLVRAAARALAPQDSGHVLVYLTRGFDSLLPILHSFRRERFVVYGYDRDDCEDNLQFSRPSNEGFLNHLATCRAVIATAGFTLLSEALYLGKPYLALPMRGQFEQQLNTWQLAEAGYGMQAAAPTAETVGGFLYHLPDFRDALTRYMRDDGRQLKEKLDHLLADQGREIRALHARMSRQEDEDGA